MDKALSSVDSANILLEYLSNKADIRATLAEAEVTEFDVKWQSVWRRVSGQMPFA